MKKSFNPDPRKQVQEAIFTRKLKTVSHPPLVYNNTNVFPMEISKTPRYHIGFKIDI